MSRYGLVQAMPPTGSSFPWAIWCANVIGSALIGLFYVIIVEKTIISAEWRPLIIVGFLGGLTTFSTFALDGILLWQNGQLSIAAAYIISSVAACLSVAVLSIYLAQRLF
jgi:CrcB protein